MTRSKLKKIPAGTYTLTFAPGCGDAWTIDKVVVAEREVAVPQAADPNGCIIVGMLLAENARG